MMFKWNRFQRKWDRFETDYSLLRTSTVIRMRFPIYFFYKNKFVPFIHCFLQMKQLENCAETEFFSSIFFLEYKMHIDEC